MKDDHSMQDSDTEMNSKQPASSPRRYKLYDRFADHVSLRTVDLVILITAVLIIGFLIYGIATGSRP